MADRLTPAQRSRNMSRIRGAGTQPEQVVQQFLRAVGIRYRINDRTLPGRPDIVVPKAKTAIFVHGCYWHRHRGCRKATTPKSNTAFWTAKFNENVLRDRRNLLLLKRMGWIVEVVWACEIDRAGTLELLAYQLLADAG